MSSSVDELVLLERVFLRVGSADSDEQLENSVSKFLTPVLLKLGSQHEDVRMKVLELLSHINKRVKTRPQVQLPIDSLLLQYQDTSSTPFITNFTIIYIKMGFPRLPQSKQAELIPLLLSSIENKPQAHKDSLLILAMTALGYIQWPSDPAKRKLFLNFHEKPIIVKQFSQVLLDTLLMPYGWGTIPPAPPGLSAYAYNRIVNELGHLNLTPEALEQLKLGVLKFLSSDAFSDEETFCPLVVAAADNRSIVASVAEAQLRKIIGSLDWESVSLLSPLYSVYLGSKEGPEDKHKAPATIRQRLKLLPFMTKARKQALLWPASIRVFFDSLYGENTHARLKTQALSFCSVIIQEVNVSQLSVVANVLMTSGLMKLISECEADMPGIRQQAYTVAGQLVSKVPSLVKNDLSLLQTLFTVLLQEENSDVRMSVRDALLTMVSAFKLDGSEKGEQLLSLLATQVESNSPSARLVAVRYLAIVFPPEHSLSRLQLLIASGDSQEEVSTEALKSLYGSSYKLSGGNIPAGLKFPQFSDITAVVSERACIRERNFNTRVSVGNHILPFTVSTYNQVLTYLSLCLAQSSGAKTSLQRLQHPCEASPQIGHFLRSLHDTNPELLDNYLKLVFKLLQANPDVVPMSSLLECVGCIPDLLSSTFVPKLEWIKNFLSDSREEMREIVAQLFGCIVGFGDENLRSLWLATLVKNLTNNTKDLELIHGTMLAIANIIERSITKHGLLSSEEHNKMSLLKIVPYLEHTQMMLVGAACNALALMSRVLPLPFTDSRIGDLNNPGKMDVVEKLLEIINSTKINSKIKERCCKAAGMLCLAENFPYRQYVLEKFIENGKEMKDVEIQLSVGEALVCCILGPTSPSIRDPWTLKEHILSIHYDPEPFCADLMDNILIKMLNIPHPHSRQACCIWLLAILKHCGHLTAVKQKLMEIQSAFMDLLSENNDIVQDVASKGLALVYESGDESLRTRLVELLVDQLTVGRRQVAQVTKDTKLFEDGSLGKSPTGGNLSTYQELCSLASDLNQPDLIYKFMHLANHNAIWNSKKGAAFGFSTIAKAAGEQLSAHLPKILPRLYRYQFDPTPKIQNSMAAIWQALVPETNKTVDLYHRAIFEDLITNLTANQWRVRTSCCLGLSDFLRGGGSKVFQDCIDLMPKLWSQLFRVMDDVHEGTRQAATSTTKIFSKLCVHSCDVESGKSGEQMVQTILPVLLEAGICHQVAEIRGVSVHTVSQLVKSAGPLLRPHLPRLIPALLEAAGELEPMALNSLSVRLAADQRSQDIVDTLRASAAKSHYTTETVSKCVQYINVDILAVMLPRLQELLRSSIGLGTRVACAHFIVLLSHHLTIEEFQPYTGKLLGALVSGLTDRNTTIRKIYASAIGQLVRSAKSSSVDKLLVKLRTNYLEKEDESVRTAIGHTLQAMARHNQEMMKSRSELTLPLVFFAMHTAKIKEDPVSVSNWELWQDVWHELAPGTETALARHIDEICSLLSTVLQSASWHVKAQAARSIETVANKLGSSLEKERRDYLVSLLVTGLAGRTWDGKEHILSALATLCKNSAFLKGTEDGQIIVDAVLRECGKEKVSYKCEALSALGEILEALETDRFKQVYDLVQEILTTEMNTEENEDHQETSKRRGELLKLKETAFITLGKAWPHNINTQVEYREKVITQCVSCLETNTRSIQVTIVTALLNYCEKLSLFDNVSTTADEEALEVILVQIIKALNYSLSISKHTLLRKEALNVLFLLAKSFKVLQRTESLQRLSSVFNEHLEELSRDNAPEVKSRVVDIKDFFRQI